MRPDTQIFLHVLGATVLFGAFATVALLGWYGRSASSPPVLAGVAFRTLLGLALPAWVVMFVFGTWAKSKEHITGSPGWLKLGAGIGLAGVLAVLVVTAVAYGWSRTPARRTLATATGALASVYLVALAVAWWVMSAKVPS